MVNALAHRNYRSTANVQIYLFSDRLEIVSPGGLPAGMTEADLGIKSVPRNPLLFNLLYRMDAVEHIGSGIRCIRDLCHEHKVAEPMIEASENWFTVTFLRSKKLGRHPADATSEWEFTSSRDQVGTKLRLSRDQVKLIYECKGERTASKLMQAIGRSNRSKFREKVLKPLMKAGLLEMTIPDKPRSKNQKYRLTAEGKVFLTSLQ